MRHHDEPHILAFPAVLLPFPAHALREPPALSPDGSAERATPERVRQAAKLVRLEGCQCGDGEGI